MATNPLEKLVKSVREYLINSSGGGRAPAVCRDNLVGALAVYDYAGELAEYDTQAQATVDLLGTPPPEPEGYEKLQRDRIEKLTDQLVEANQALAELEQRHDEDKRYILEAEGKYVPPGFELVSEARASAYRAVAIHAERLMRSGLQANHLVALQGALDALNETLPGQDEA